MNQNSLTKLEYEKIIEMVQKKCSSDLAKEVVKNIVPSTDKEQVVSWQKETSEAVLILRYDGTLPLAGISDTYRSISLAEKGGILQKDDIGKIRENLYAAKNVTNFFNRRLQYEAPLLKIIISEIQPVKELETAIEAILDEDSQIRDTASETLWSIRRKKKSLNEKIRSKLEQIIKNPNSSKYLQESIVTDRYGRYVVPVKIEYRQNVPGIIHDQSSSGATLFIEPAAVVELNNDLKKYELQETEEITRILLMISSHIAGHAHVLKNNLDKLTKIDTIMAKGLLSAELDCVEPVISDDQRVTFKLGRHPLIPNHEVVPITLNLGYDFDALVITGPNTGGKTVTLKTTGLFVLMAQSGLHLPAERAETGIFEKVFCDIGDEQSIEQSLSTFSSHMTNIVNIIKNTDDQTLVLLDELGAGTDPSEGANLAIAIIKYFIAQKAKIIATTHYSDLKVFAYNYDRVENASVEFDTISLKPTYRLLVGVPGKSNALDIADRLGLDKGIIAEARGMVSDEDQDVSGLIEKLEKDAFYAEQNLEQTKLKLAEAERKFKDLQDSELKLKEREEKIIKKAEEEAYKIIRAAKTKTTEKIKELKELILNDKEEALKKANVFKAQLDEDTSQLYDKITTSKGTEESFSGKEFTPGMEVYVPKFSQKGIVLDVLTDELYIQLGIMKMKISKKDVSVPQTNEVKPSKTGIAKLKDQKLMAIKPEVDVRGQTVEEALLVVDKYLDDAKIAGLTTVSIIHGKGTGALRAAITDDLKRHPYVVRYRMGDTREGGHGVTIVELQ